MGLSRTLGQPVRCCRVMSPRPSPLLSRRQRIDQKGREPSLTLQSSCVLKTRDRAAKCYASVLVSSSIRQ